MGDEITRLNESGVMSTVMEEEKERKISCLKVNIKELKTSNEFFNKQLLQQRDETTELSVKLKTEIDSSDKLKILSKMNQDEITRLNELKEISEAMIVTEKNKFICSTQTISCLKEDIKSITTSKESFEKQLLQQRDETTDLIVKFKAVIKSGNKQKMLSKENQDEITRLNESRDLLKDNKEEKERMISCLIEDIKEFETSKEGFEKQLLQQRDETTELTFKLESEIDSSNKEKMLSNERKVEIKMLYEMVDLLEVSAGENENELIFSTQTISRLKEDIKELETSKEGFDKQLLHQRDETGELTLKLRAEIESGNKLKILSKKNQDEIIGLNKSIDLSETIAEEKERTISCLKEDIKELETSKEGFGKQSQQQRDETAELSVRLKTMIDSGNKLKILSKERQDEITRLNESRELLKTIAEENENELICSTQTISCLKEDIKEFETSKEVLVKQLIQQRDETSELALKLNTVIESGNKLKILSKENQGEIIRLNESRDLLEASIGEKESTISCLKEDIKELETSKEDFDKQLLHQKDETSELTLKLNTVIESGNKLKILSKENQDEIIRLNESRNLLEASIEEKENELTSSIQTISSLKEDIKLYKMNHDCDLIKIEEVNHNLTCVKDDLSSSHNQITILTNEIECKIDVQEKLKLINIQNEENP